MTLLHIYDASSFLDSLFASIRRKRRLISGVHPVPVKGGKYALMVELDNIASSGQRFSRAVFETHGSSGAIHLEGEKIDGDTWRTYYKNRGYEQIFNAESRIYFNGCNIAEDPYGWDFLDAAGSLFLGLRGGVTFAQTGLGRVYLFGGTVVHFGASICYSVWGPGGQFIGHEVKKPKTLEEAMYGPGSLIGDTMRLARWLSKK